MTSNGDFRRLILAEIMRDAHRYAPGVQARSGPPTLRGRLRSGRERGRDLLERAAERAGFSHRHFDPDLAAERLSRLMELADGLDFTYAHLADERSRQALVAVLKLRVLGPRHASLEVTPQAYRAHQEYAERRLCAERATFEVSDPWFSPLSLYRAPVDGSTVSLHSHSVDIVSVFLLGQYAYRRGRRRVVVEPGDAVFDVGGCWGDTALQFAARGGTVSTFEFDPESLEILEANLRLNPGLAARIEVVRSALWDRSGEMLEFTPAGRMTTVIEVAERAAAPRVQTITLDDYVAEAGIERLDFVKMDVEGAELRVLAGARETLRRFRPKLAIAAYHRDDDLVTIPADIHALGLGYEFYLDTFSPVEEETVLFAAPPAASV